MRPPGPKEDSIMFDPRPSAATGTTRPRSASAPAASPSCLTPARRPASSARCWSPIPASPSCRWSPRRSDPAADAGLGAALFDDVKANPVAKNVEDGLKVLRAGKHDGVIAFGGGIALDAAKVIAFMAGQKRPMWDFEDIGDWWTRADTAGIFPAVAVPTTAGTGSEVGRAGVIIDETTHTKKIIFHPRMMPAVVIADPELTVGLPPRSRPPPAWTPSPTTSKPIARPFYHPYADGVAVEGVRLVKEYLPARRRRRQGPRGARLHARRRRHGRDRVPEGPRRHPRALAPGGRGATTPITASPMPW